MSQYKVGRKRTYRERAQPKKRKHLGLLEKHKDYVERARDYNLKKKRIKSLREKAATRNPDEFYFRMISSKTDESGKHVVVDKERFNADELALMDKQDHSYLQTHQTVERKKVEKLKANLHSLTTKPSNKHVIFVDDEQQLETFNAVKHFDTVPEALNRAYNRPKIKDLQQAPLTNATQQEIAEANHLKNLRYKRLAARLERQEKLERLTTALELRKNLKGKGKRKKVKGKSKTANGVAVYKWAQDRKK